MHKTFASLATLLVATLALIATPASAQELVSSLVTPTATPPGSVVTVDLLRVNPTSMDMPFAAPDVLRGRLIAGARSWPVELQARATGTTDVAAGSFASRNYTLQLPPDAIGTLVLEVTQEATQEPGQPPTAAAILRAVVQVEAGAGPRVGEGAPRTPPPSPLTSIAPEAAQTQAGFVGRFSVHEPIYFLYGDEDPGAKFQFSFKYRVLNLPAVFGQRPAVKFGYTQRSLWELGSSSSPFYDTSYMPSLFTEWLAPAREPEESGRISLLGLQGGYQHESNGQPDDQSRSLNTVFARASFALGPTDGFHVVATPRIFTYVGGLSDNRELARYRGHGDLQLTFGRTKGTALSYTGRVGRGFHNSTTQLDLTIPIRTRWLDFGSYFMVQYFNGYGENLRDYDQHFGALRIGVALLR